VLRGRCSCNAIAYEASDAFLVAYNCHCPNCRALTGSAFLPWGEIERDKLTVTKGADLLMVTGDAGCPLRGVRIAAPLDWPRRRSCPHRVWVTCRRAGTQTDRSHVRRLKGAVV
jgi:hypothetical protein